MPRIRSVPPEICELEALVGVSAYAERTFLRLWTHADDEGRAKDNPRLLRAQLYPLDDSMTVERVEKDLGELAWAGLLQRYTVDSKGYVCVDPSVWSWQKPRRRVPSKLPPSPPPDNVRTPPDNDRTCTAGGGGVVGDGEELEKEGESEGEPAAPPPNGGPVDNPAHPLARRALHVAGDTA